ncbi:MAG: hypothetical protein EON92_13130, partial [Burkholderiales bacterium]
MRTTISPAAHAHAAIESPAAEAALHAVQEAWSAAGISWNAEALSHVYTPDAIFFGGRPGHSIGREAIKEYFASYDDMLQSTTLRLVDQQVIEIGTDLYLAQGYGEFSFVLADGNAAKSVSRTTLLIV